MTDIRIVPCPACMGDKGHEVPYEIDRSNGGFIAYWQDCRECGASGDVEIELEPIELDDLVAACGPVPESTP